MSGTMVDHTHDRESAFQSIWSSQRVGVPGAYRIRRAKRPRPTLRPRTRAESGAGANACLSVEMLRSERDVESAVPSAARGADEQRSEESFLQNGRPSGTDTRASNPDCGGRDTLTWVLELPGWVPDVPIAVAIQLQERDPGGSTPGRLRHSLGA